MPSRPALEASDQSGSQSWLTHWIVAKSFSASTLAERRWRVTLCPLPLFISAITNALNLGNHRVDLDNDQIFGGFHWNKSHRTDGYTQRCSGCFLKAYTLVYPVPDLDRIHSNGSRGRF